MNDLDDTHEIFQAYSNVEILESSDEDDTASEYSVAKADVDEHINLSKGL